jgi:predicted AlkP superfamily phosphohydrolase/phosphomutase
MANRVIVLGIDGATFDILDPWVQAGWMPHLAGLFSGGCRATMRSTIPPYTPQAWVSMMTGKTPAQHGVVDFVERGEDRTARGFVSSTLIAGEAVWDTASRHGRSVGVLNMPLTYPPRPLNGFMVSGLLTPRDRQDYTYPAELRQEILSAVPGYEPDPYEPLSLDRDVANFAQWTQNGEVVARHLHESRPVDLFINVVQTIDFLQHILWRALSDPAVRAKAPFDRLWPTVLNLIGAVDDQIGERLRWMDNSTTLFLVSDHGFQPVKRWFYVNRWLQQQGWLHLQAPHGGLGQALAARGHWTTRDIKALVRRLDVLGLRRYLGRLARGRIADQLEASLAAPIDWTRTRASCAPSTNEGIYVNVQGRDANGIVAPGNEYEDARSQIMAELAELRDPATGRTVVSAVHRREDVYSGEFLELMPDILMEFEDRPYLVSETTAGAAPLAPMPEGYVEGRHHPRGIFAAFGPLIEPGRTLPDVSIVDVAPTLLYALDLPVPADMTGRVVERAFRPDYRDEHPVRSEDGSVAPTGRRQGSSYDQEEEDDMRRRLQGLGYLT